MGQAEAPGWGVMHRAISNVRALGIFAWTQKTERSRFLENREVSAASLLLWRFGP